MAYLALRYVRTSVSGRAAYVASSSSDCREKKDEEEEEERGGWREGKAREKLAVSPSMLLLRDKAEDADVCTRVDGIQSVRSQFPFAVLILRR